MLNLDFVCFGVLRAAELCSTWFHLMTFWNNFQLKNWTMGRIEIWVIGHSTRDHDTTPFLRKKDEQFFCEKQRKNPLKRRLDKSNHSKAKTYCNHCMVLAWRNVPNHTRKLLLCRYIVNLPWSHNKGPEGPHGESSATCVQWCGWGSCSHRSCLQRSQLAWWIKPDCTNCCYEAPNSAGAGSLGHISSPLHLLQPSVICNPVSGPSSYLPRSTFSAAQGVPQLCFQVDAALSTLWPAYLLASGSTSFQFVTPADEQAMN